MSYSRVPRWTVGLLATLALVAVGLLYANGALLAAALVPLAYVIYGTVSTLPDDRTLRVERRVESAMPAPGSPVDVTLTVENEGGQVLPDVRVVDGVPDELVVTEGTARLCASLSPGECQTCRYTVVARQGTYTFDRPVARLRSLAGSVRQTTELDADGDDELVAVSPLEAGPKQTQTTPHTGPVTADSGGSGLEFHSTRQYRQGDPVNRIDWHHVAKTGDFITVQYREQKTSRTVLVVDARPVNRVTPAAGYPTAVARSRYAAERLYETLTDAGIEVRVAVVGLTGDIEGVTPNPSGIVWAGPGTQTAPETAFAAVTRADTQPDRGVREPPRAGPETPLSWADRAPETAIRADGGETPGLLAEIPSDARVVVCSPLVDNWPVGLCHSLGGERELVVVSPDPVGTRAVGQRLTNVARHLRLRALGRTEASTVDWSPEQPFEIALRDALPDLVTHR
ncbi:protein of unknown function DUF11 [Halovenus aranensis]|uniref:DUF58 domain-containing protein n=1 Tax=Halovenus aranensis TaxID=890420 RepID=A0A1G8X3X0_9EURY|nr:DUF58 domain-containing protein [Halovenus aranensis]SDJ85328.1 protein of unknown function DUF11 [Halovenus aranensis]